MISTFEAIYDNGVLILQSPVGLADGERVRVSVESLESEVKAGKRSPGSVFTDIEVSPPCELPRAKCSAEIIVSDIHRLPDGITD